MQNKEKRGKKETNRIEEKGGEGKEYKGKKKEYRKLCDRKKKKENEKWKRKGCVGGDKQGKEKKEKD